MTQMSQDVEAGIRERKKFYNDPEVAKLISRDGVPKTKKAMAATISAGTSGKSDSPVAPELFECLSFVVFAVHPQQINVRDKTTGKIIAVIAR